MASASGYNHHRFARAVLKKSRRWEPSLVVQLHAQYWRFAESASPPPSHFLRPISLIPQTITFAYDGPMKPFLLALRAQVIPASLIPFLYDIKPAVAFVDGCLVVEIQDFRKTPEVKSRVVMRPAAESLAQTIEAMLERRYEQWDEQLALELESRIIAATSPPLYLGTSILATRNAVLALNLTSPATSTLSAEGNFRPPTARDEPASTSERMRKLLLAGERSGPFQPSWSILRTKDKIENNARAQREAASRQAAAVPELAVWNNPPGQAEEKKKKKKKPEDKEKEKERKRKAESPEVSKEDKPKKKKKKAAE